MQACPEFASWVRSMDRIPGRLVRSEHAWNVAQDRMGTQVAMAAFALVFEKHSASEVASPDGYLRRMGEKAGAGKLHLERSFYGRLSGQAA